MSDYSVILGGKGLSDTIEWPLSKLSEGKRKGNEIQYGEYPKDIIYEKINTKELLKTEKVYHANGYTIQEYQYGDRKLVEITADRDEFKNFDNYYHLDPLSAKDEYEDMYWGSGVDYYDDKYEYDKNRTLDNGKKLIYGAEYWIEVAPVIWEIDDEKGTAVAKGIELREEERNKFEEDIKPSKKIDLRQVKLAEFKKKTNEVHELQETIKELQKKAAKLRIEISEDMASLAEENSNEIKSKKIK